MQSVAQDAFVYHMGDPTDHLYLLLDGRVRTSIVTAAGQEYILHDYGPGEAFGELCFCEVRARQEQAVALSPAKVVRIGLEELQAFTGDDGLWPLVEMFTHRLAELERQLHELSTQGVRERLLRFLLREADEVGADGFAPVGARLTHQEIAARIFTTREQVSAHLAALRREGLVRYGRGQGMAIAPAKLQAEIL